MRAYEKRNDEDVVQKRKGKTTFANYNYKTCNLFE